MTDPWKILAHEGFHFFGKMAASISHEIKNTLAIINEKAGLLEDLSLLAGQGRPLDPERLQSLAVQIGKQIQRADGLVKRLNRFAHSTDDPVKTIDVGEALELISALAQRLAAMREAQVELVLPGQPVPLATHPFLLENLIWACLEFLLTENHKNVKLILEPEREGLRLRWKGQFPFPKAPTRPFPGEAEQALLTILQAELRMDPSAAELIVWLPKNHGSI